jgi:hypothetical protein
LSQVAWALSRGNDARPFHLFTGAHWHNTNVAMRDGTAHVIFGACAGQSGFETMLGYSTGQPATGFVKVNSHTGIELMVSTKSYLELQEEELRNVPEYKALCDKYGSIEDFIETTRLSISGRQPGAFDYGKLPSLVGRTIDAKRKIGNRKIA